MSQEREDFLKPLGARFVCQDLRKAKILVPNQLVSIPLWRLSTEQSTGIEGS